MPQILFWAFTWLETLMTVFFGKIIVWKIFTFYKNCKAPKFETDQLIHPFRNERHIVFPKMLAQNCRDFSSQNTMYNKVNNITIQYEMNIKMYLAGSWKVWDCKTAPDQHHWKWNNKYLLSRNVNVGIQTKWQKWQNTAL